MRKIFVLLCLLLSLCSSCKKEVPPLPPDDRFDVDLEDYYDLNEGVYLTISIGFNKDDKNWFLSYQGKYVLSYSKERPSKNEPQGIVVLETITDFSDDKYYYTEEKNKIIFNYQKKYLIDENIFDNTEGEFFVFMYQTESDYSRNTYSMLSKFEYTKQESIVYIKHSK